MCCEKNQTVKAPSPKVEALSRTFKLIRDFPPVKKCSSLKNSYPVKLHYNLITQISSKTMNYLKSSGAPLRILGPFKNSGSPQGLGDCSRILFPPPLKNSGPLIYHSSALHCGQLIREVASLTICKNTMKSVINTLANCFTLNVHFKK